MRLTPHSLNNAALSIFGSVTVDGDVLGNVTGNLTGNVTGNLTGDVNGSIFADDSTLLVDGVSGTIPWSVISGAPTIPTDTNQLTNGANYITLAEVPAIPTNISTFTNDSGYITASSDLKGSIFADDSTLLVDGVSGQIVGDINAKLAGDLNVNGFSIVSTGNGNISINPAGTGNIVLQGSLSIDSLGNFIKVGDFNISPSGITSFGNNATSVDGNVYITRNS
jgi:hypothetical protein